MIKHISHGRSGVDPHFLLSSTPPSPSLAMLTMIDSADHGHVIHTAISRSRDRSGCSHGTILSRVIQPDRELISVYSSDGTDNPRMLWIRDEEKRTNGRHFFTRFLMQSCGLRLLHV
jgi:hypothetical protein